MACSDSSPRELQLVAVTPSIVSSQYATAAIIRGKNFDNTVRARLDRRQAPQVGRRWQVRISERSLSQESIERRDEETLSIMIPSGLQLGLHDVSVTAPAGQTATLEDALRVIENPLGAGGTVGAAGADDGWSGGGQDQAGGGRAVAGSAGAAGTGDAGGAAQAGSGTSPATGGATDAGAAGQSALGGAGGSGAAGHAGAGNAAGLGGWATAGAAGASSTGGLGGSATAGNAGASNTGGLGGSGGTGPIVGSSPVAWFDVTPGAGTTLTDFVFDASRTYDHQDPNDQLTYAWDWNEDDTYDPQGITVSHRFAEVGLHPVRLRVEDSSGLAGFFEGFVQVVSAADLIVVDTDQDVIDSADGLTSLREALETANARSTASVVTFAGPMVISLSIDLPPVTSPAPVHIFGQPGVVIDGAQLAQECLYLITGNHSVVGLEVTGCVSAAVRIDGTGNWIAYSRLHDSGFGVAFMGSGSRVGPHNDIFANSIRGLEVVGDDHLIEQNRIRDNQTGLMVANGSRVAVLGNQVEANTLAGLMLGSGADGLRVWHNTIHGNGTTGLQVHANSTGLSVQNNLFTQNGSWAIDGADRAFAELDYNLYFANPAGSCDACTPGPASQSVDPLYIDPASSQLYLQPLSPAIDAAAALGYDANGAQPGLFNGPAPDIGCHEAP